MLPSGEVTVNANRAMGLGNMRRERIHDAVADLVGRTPLVRLRARPDLPGIEILAKVEGMNPLGSVKERIARHMIEEGERSGALRPGMTILESSSGNTGIGLAMIAASRGYSCTIVMPEKASSERAMILRALGANVVFTVSGGTSDDACRMADEMHAADPDRTFRTAQYRNPANVRAHETTTGPEIWEDCGGRLDAFVATVGTCGTVTGAGRFLKSRDPRIRVVAVEPQPDHCQQGLRNLSVAAVPEILDWSVVDERIVIDDAEAFAAARGLASEEGIFAGISSGTAVAAARRVGRALAARVAQGTATRAAQDSAARAAQDSAARAAQGTAARAAQDSAVQAAGGGRTSGEGPLIRVVTLLPDRGERYLSTPLFDPAL